MRSLGPWNAVTDPNERELSGAGETYEVDRVAIVKGTSNERGKRKMGVSNVTTHVEESTRLQLDGDGVLVMVLALPAPRTGGLTGDIELGGEGRSNGMQEGWKAEEDAGIWFE